MHTYIHAYFHTYMHTYLHRTDNQKRNITFATLGEDFLKT